MILSTRVLLSPARTWSFNNSTSSSPSLRRHPRADNQIKAREARTVGYKPTAC